MQVPNHLQKSRLVMHPTLATHRLKLVPVAADDAGFVASMLAMLAAEPGEVWRQPVEAVMQDHRDTMSMTALWRIVTAEDATAGVIGLSMPRIAVGQLRAIGWRSLEMTVTMAPRHRRRGLASEAIDALVHHALSDGVTFAVLAAVAASNEAGHALVRRSRFEELGRVAGSVEPIVVYERAG